MHFDPFVRQNGRDRTSPWRWLAASVVRLQNSNEVFLRGAERAAEIAEEHHEREATEREHERQRGDHLAIVAGEFSIHTRSSTPVVGDAARVVVHSPSQRRPALPSALLRKSQTNAIWQGRYAVLQTHSANLFSPSILALDVDLARTVWLCSVRPAMIGLRLVDDAREFSLISARLADIRHLAALSHPTLPAIYDAWIDDGTIWVVVEKVEGAPLQSYLATVNRQRAATVLRLAEQVATAVRELARINIEYCLWSAKCVVVGESGQARLIDLFGGQNPEASHERAPITAALRRQNVRPRELALRMLCEVLAGICEQQANRRDLWAWIEFSHNRRILLRAASFFRTWSHYDRRIDDGVWDQFIVELTELQRQRSGHFGAFTAVVALGFGLAASIVPLQQRANNPCAEIPAAWSRVWNAERRETLIASTPVGQRELARGLADYLDAEQDSWLQVHRAHCEDNAEPVGERGSAGSSQCLLQWAADVGHVGTLAGAGNLQKALDWLPSLDEPNRCTERSLHDPRAAQVANRDRVAFQQIATQLRRAEQLRLAGEYQAASAIEQESRAAAQAFLPLVAEAKLLQVELNEGPGRRTALLRGAADARLLAVAANESTVQARASTSIVFNLESIATDQARWREGWRQAHAALQRASDDADLPRAELLYELGAAAAMFGQNALARQSFAQSVIHIDPNFEKRHARLTAGIYTGIGYFHLLRGEIGDSENYVERGLAIARRAYGPQQIGLAHPLVNAALVDAYAGRFRRAQDRGQELEELANTQIRLYHSVSPHVLEDIIAILLLAGECHQATNYLAQAAPGDEPLPSFVDQARLRVLAQVLRLARHCQKTAPKRIVAELAARIQQWTTPTHDNAPILIEWQLYRVHAEHENPNTLTASIAALESILAAQVHHEGLLHHELALLRARLAHVHGNREVAQRVLTAAVQQAEQVYGDRTILAAFLLEHLAQVQRDNGDFVAAEQAALRAVERISHQLGPNSPRLSLLYAWLAEVQALRGDFASALTYADEAKRLADPDALPPALRRSIQALLVVPSNMHPLVSPHPSFNLFGDQPFHEVHAQPLARKSRHAVTDR